MKGNVVYFVYNAVYLQRSLPLQIGNFVFF